MRTHLSRVLGVLAVLALAWVDPVAAQGPTVVENLKTRVAALEAQLKALEARLAKVEGKSPTAPPVKVALGAGKISVLAGDWGDADRDNIEAVLRSAASELSRHLTAPSTDPIAVRHDGKRGPMVLFGKGADGERRVLISSRDRSWSQFAFQFAHEFCHIQCNYREGNRNNLWFEESLCETASLFALRRMAETWKTKPPYGNWKSYAPSLNGYAEDRITKIEKLDGLSFAQWYQRNEQALRETGTNREKNQVVAVELLKLFEKSPNSWQAIRSLNQWDGTKDLSFAQYLREWHSHAPNEHKPFVAEVAELFKVALK